MEEKDIIYGCDLPKLSNDELLDYYTKLVQAIEKGWEHEGRYILKDCARYEVKDRMRLSYE